jgi:hypothetical protein
MYHAISSRIMRTTLDIADPILREVKALQRRSGKSLGQMVSDLLAHALHAEKRAAAPPAPSAWICREMGARVDVSDADALYNAMERPRAADGKSKAQP